MSSAQVNYLFKALPLLLFLLVVFGFLFFIASIMTAGWDFKLLSAVIYTALFSFVIGFVVHRWFYSKK